MHDLTTSNCLGRDGIVHHEHVYTIKGEGMVLLVRCKGGH